MDNEFKRRLIRHLETAFRTYQHRLDPKSRPADEPKTTAELAEACDDCIKMLAMLRRG
jgi:hypothetical protein